MCVGVQKTCVSNILSLTLEAEYISLSLKEHLDLLSLKLAEHIPPNQWRAHVKARQKSATNQEMQVMNKQLVIL